MKASKLLDNYSTEASQLLLIKIFPRSVAEFQKWNCYIKGRLAPSIT